MEVVMSLEKKGMDLTSLLKQVEQDEGDGNLKDDMKELVLMPETKVLMQVLCLLPLIPSKQPKDQLPGLKPEAGTVHAVYIVLWHVIGQLSETEAPSKVNEASNMYLAKRVSTTRLNMRLTKPVTYFHLSSEQKGHNCIQLTVKDYEYLLALSIHEDEMMDDALRKGLGQMCFHKDEFKALQLQYLINSCETYRVHKLAYIKYALVRITQDSSWKDELKVIQFKEEWLN